MTDFKIGDRIKAKAMHMQKVLAHFHEYWMGDGSTNEFTVYRKSTEYDGQQNICISQGRGGPQWPADYFKLITQPKFKAGDVVRPLINFSGQFNTSSTYIVREFPDRYGHVGMKFDDSGSRSNGIHPDYVQHTASKTAIVALVVDGKPYPAASPYVHATTESATTEAERLSVANPGQVFAVYERVTARIADKPVARVAA